MGLCEQIVNNGIQNVADIALLRTSLLNDLASGAVSTTDGKEIDSLCVHLLGIINARLSFDPAIHLKKQETSFSTESSNLVIHALIKRINDFACDSD